MASIKLATGIKTYDIEDENGNIRGSISFNPADMNFLVRAEQLRDNVAALSEKLMSETVETEEQLIAKLEEYDLAIKKEINMLFDDENTSKVVFGNQSCFNTVKGEPLIEGFLNSILPVIKRDFQREMEKSRDRIAKYVEVK